MSEETDLDLYQAPNPVEEPPPTSRPPSPWPVVAGILILVAAAAAWYFWRPQRLEPPVTSAEPAAARPATTPPPAAASEPQIVTTLPPLDESDPAVRDLVTALSGHVLVSAWLGGEHLLRNAASVVAAVAEGRSPASLLRRLAPAGQFAVRQSGGRTVIDPSSYRRYTPVADALDSLDPQAAARVYASVKPRLGDAYADLGTGGSIDDVVKKAIAQVIAVPVVEGDVAVVPSGLVYAYADPGLEDRPPVQKLLLRMGPDNVRRIQAKAKAFAAAAGIVP